MDGDVTVPMLSAALIKQGMEQRKQEILARRDSMLNMLAAAYIKYVNISPDRVELVEIKPALLQAGQQMQWWFRPRDHDLEEAKLRDRVKELEAFVVAFLSDMEYFGSIESSNSIYDSARSLMMAKPKEETSEQTIGDNPTQQV